MKTVRRDWLKKQIASGQWEAKCDHDIEHDGDGRYDRFNGPWIPARLRSGYDDWREGMMNLWNHDFTGNCGRAYWQTADHVTLIVHSNLCYTLRRKVTV